MSKPQRATADSPRTHDAPPDHAPRYRHELTTLAAQDREPALSADPKELNRYLDALLDRERATPLSRYSQVYRDFEREVPLPRENPSQRDIERARVAAEKYHASMGEILPEIPITTDAAGREHLSPSWRAFDPGLAREIRYQIRALETSRRFDGPSTLQLPFDGIPARGERPEEIILPRPQYRGAKAGRRIVGVGRPTAQSVPTFYLPRKSEVNDTLSASSARSLVGGGKFGDKTPRADRVSDSDQFEAIALCFDVARAVNERIVSVDSLAEVIVRLNAPSSVRDTCFSLLGHRDRKRLGKALREHPSAF
jgi:hypothetical protein